MAFLKSEVSPPCIIEPGSCHAARVEAAMSFPIERAPVTAEWLAENEAKQKAYEDRRREWRKRVGVAETDV
jgi:hypothetical protein